MRAKRFAPAPRVPCAAAVRCVVEVRVPKDDDLSALRLERIGDLEGLGERAVGMKRLRSIRAPNACKRSATSIANVSP